MPILADFLGAKPKPATPNPDALSVLLNGGGGAPDLTGYFDQLNTSRNPVHVAGIDEQAAAEQKREEEARQAQFEENDPNIKAAKAAELTDKLALQGEPNRVAGEYGLKNEAMKAKAATDVEAMKAAGASAPKYGQQEQAMIDSAQGINALGVPLLQKYEAKFPGISQDATKYGASANGDYGGIMDALGQKGRMLAYTFGMKTDQDEMLQDTAAIQALAVRALSQGRITKPVMEMIQQHLPQPGFAPGANYVRLNELITKILPGQLQGMNTGHGANPLILSPDPMSQIVGPR